MNSTADVKLKLNDKELFGNDAGEDEDVEVLVSYFVDQESYKDFLNQSERLYVARARKGMGKSALLAKMAYEVGREAKKPFVIQATPAHLMAVNRAPESTSPAVLENYWKQVICQLINHEIAKSIGFSWRDDKITIVESAEIAGFKGRNIIGALASRLLSKVNVSGAIELKYEPGSAANNEQVLKRIREEESDGREVWFFLDDIDSKFKNTEYEQAYISSFFSACRSLVRDIKGIYIRASVRTDVWTNLGAAEDLDKFEQYICDISWNNSQQKDILVKRIHSYVMRNYPQSYVAKNWTVERHSDDIIELAFERRMRWGDSRVPAIQVLRILSAGRPRWMAQLCKFAGIEAEKGGVKIGIKHINQILFKYSSRRLSDLYKEHNHQFASLQALVECFSGGARRYSTKDLLGRIMDNFIRLKGASGIPAIDGEAYRDSWQLAHLIYKCGFIVGHNQQKAGIDSPEFISFDMRPDLLKVGANLDDGMLWEIQPSYRTAIKVK